MAENWVMVVSEMHRYQGVSYKSDIIVISGLAIFLKHLYPHHPYFDQVLILEIDKYLNRNTVAANPPASLTLQMEGSPPPPNIRIDKHFWIFSEEKNLFHCPPRFVLKGPCYNPLDVMNCLMTRRGYKVISPVRGEIF